MVQRARKIVWTLEALETKTAIFSYWNNRNKSTLYSQKLNIHFKEALIKIRNFPEATKHTTNDAVRLLLVRDYYLVLNIADSVINVLEIWDTRQNPKDFPIK